MNELKTLEDYKRIVRAITPTECSVAILNGDADSYPLHNFRDDIVEALRKADLEYAQMDKIIEFAKASIDGGLEPARLHKALAKVAKENIYWHCWWLKEEEVSDDQEKIQAS